MEESPRFELLQKNFDNGFRIIDLMNKQNEGTAVIDEVTKFKLQNWAHSQNRIAKNQQNVIVFVCIELCG